MREHGKAADEKDAEDENALEDGVGEDEENQAGATEAFVNGMDEETPGGGGRDADHCATEAEEDFAVSAKNECEHDENHDARGGKQGEPEPPDVDLGRRGRDAGDHGWFLGAVGMVHTR